MTLLAGKMSENIDELLDEVFDIKRQIAKDMELEEK